jgi:hypothetical protein
MNGLCGETNFWMAAPDKTTSMSPSLPVQLSVSRATVHGTSGVKVATSRRAPAAHSRNRTAAPSRATMLFEAPSGKELFKERLIAVCNLLNGVVRHHQRPRLQTQANPQGGISK